MQSYFFSFYYRQGLIITFDGILPSGRSSPAFFLKGAWRTMRLKGKTGDAGTQGAGGGGRPCRAFASLPSAARRGAACREGMRCAVENRRDWSGKGKGCLPKTGRDSLLEPPGKGCSRQAGSFIHQKHSQGCQLSILSSSFDTKNFSIYYVGNTDKVLKNHNIIPDRSSANIKNTCKSQVCNRQSINRLLRHF